MPSQGARQLKTIIGENIRAAREARELTQGQLARLLDELMEPMTVSRWERGAAAPAMTNLVRLGEVLGQDVAWFYTDHSGAPANAA
jgi:transcriptional regulator with XRE-family HTH domain